MVICNNETAGEVRQASDPIRLARMVNKIVRLPDPNGLSLPIFLTHEQAHGGRGVADAWPLSQSISFTIQQAGWGLPAPAQPGKFSL